MNGTVGVMEHPEHQLPLHLIRFRPRPTAARRSAPYQARLHGKVSLASEMLTSAPSLMSANRSRSTWLIAQRNAWTERR